MSFSADPYRNLEIIGYAGANSTWYCNSCGADGHRCEPLISGDKVTVAEMRKAFEAHLRKNHNAYPEDFKDWSN